MDGEDRRILEELGPWLEGRALRVAKRLGHAGDTADLTQEALTTFYTNAPKWLDQPAEISRVAQIRYWLVVCLRRAATEYFKRHAHEQLGDGAGPEEDACGELPCPSIWSGGESDVVARIDDGNRLRRLHEMILEKLPPPRSLYILAIYAPHRLQIAQLEKASGYRAGGARPVRRSVEASWELFCQQRRDPGLVQDAARWKRTVAEIFQLEGPLGSHAERELDRAVNNIDQQLSRAIRQLAELMQGERS